MNTLLRRVGRRLAAALCVMLATTPVLVPSAANAQDEGLETLLDRLKLPDGFRIELVTDQVPGARSLAWGESGTLFVGTRRTGVVYAVTGIADDGKAERVSGRVVVRAGLTTSITLNPGGIQTASK